MRLQHKIALRYLVSRKSHSAVNIISAVALAGVAVAAAAMVCVLSVFNGFSDLADTSAGRFIPDYKIIPSSGKTLAGDSLARQLLKQPGVVAAVPVLQETALAVTPAAQHGVDLMGVGPGWKQNGIIDGEFSADDFNSGRPVAVLHAALAMAFQQTPAESVPIEVYLPKRVGRINPANPATGFRSDSLHTTGVFQMDYADETASSTMVIPISRLRQLLDYENGEASYIAVTANRPPTPPTGTVMLDRRQQNAASARIINIEKWITFLMLAFIMLIASFNIISSLTMMIIEKGESISVLRSLGMPPSGVRGIFVTEGWLVNATGGLIGVAAGIALVLAQQWGGFIKLGGDHDMMLVTAYPVHLYWSDIPAVLGAVALTGLICAGGTAMRRAPFTGITTSGA